VEGQNKTPMPKDLRKVSPPQINHRQPTERKKKKNGKENEGLDQLKGQCYFLISEETRVWATKQSGGERKFPNPTKLVNLNPGA